jgi:hypothetical protein
MPLPSGYCKSSVCFLDWTYLSARFANSSCTGCGTISFRNGYSAKVALTLKIAERDIALSHVGPGKVSVQELCEELPSSDAKLVIEVDDSSEVMNVYLPHGISATSYDVTYV